MLKRIIGTIIIEALLTVVFVGMVIAMAEVTI